MAVNKVEYGGETLIDLTNDTVASETLAEGVTAHDAAGNPIVGTIPNNGEFTATMDGIDVKSIDLPNGIISGGKVSLDDTIGNEVNTQSDLISQIKEKANALPELATLPRAEGVSNFTEEEYAIYGSTLTAIADAMRYEASVYIGDDALTPEDMAERMWEVYDNGYDDGYSDGTSDVYYPLRRQSLFSPEYDSDFDDFYFYSDIYETEDWWLPDFLGWEVTSSSSSCTFSFINYSDRWVKVFVYFYCELYNSDPYEESVALLIEPGGTGEISRGSNSWHMAETAYPWDGSDLVGVRFI